MSKLPYFPFYPSDFIADTQLLTDKEVGAYFRLLLIQWINGAIPTNKIPLLIEDYDLVWPEIKQYFITDHGKVSNKRLERERIKAIALIDVRSEAGKAGAKARWDGKGNAIANGKSNSKQHGKTMLPQNSELIVKNIEPKSQSTHILRAHEAYRLICSRKPSSHEILQITQLVHDHSIETVMAALEVCGDYKWDKINHLKKVISGEWPRKEKDEIKFNKDALI